MSRRLAPITLDNVGDLPSPCRGCVSWEFGRRGDPEESVKDDWVGAVLLDWGSCGRILYVDGRVAGFAIYAPAQYVGGTKLFATSSVSADAVLMTTLRVLPEYWGGGLGRVLVQGVAKDLIRRRGVRAIECFGDARAGGGQCVVPADFLTAVGFKTVQAHPRYPRLRLDLRSVLTWKSDVEVAIERLLGAIRPEKAAGPVGVRTRTEPTHEL